MLRKAEGSTTSSKVGVIAGAILGVFGLLGFGSMFIIHPEVVAVAPAAQTVAVAPEQEQKNWANYGNDPGTGRFAALDQISLANVSQLSKAPNACMGQVPLGGTPYAVIKDRFLSPLGIPCQKPPFGTMTAASLKTQKIAWQVPIGTVQDTGPMGVKMNLPFEVGMPAVGGSLATQGGLLFFAGTQDYYLRAFDTANGNEVWKQRLPVGSQGTPITFKSPKTGKQYIVISAGGARQSPDRGDYVIAYALPDSK